MRVRIRPHFLYNALGAISNLCQKDDLRASHLLDDLAVYMRNCLAEYNPDSLITLDADLDFVHAYLHIEQARFGQRIQVLYTIDAWPESLLPVLVLQPLVENAVRHGIARRPAGGLIRVQAAVVPGGVLYQVQDNGVGMMPDQIDTVFQPDLPAGGGTLRYIHARLLQLTGKGLTIDSQPGQGTHVEFMVPEVCDHAADCGH